MIELSAAPRGKSFQHPWTALAYVIGQQWSGPFSGTVELYVHQGGLRHREISADSKQKFRENISPWLNESAGVTGGLTGKIIAHMAEGTLKRAFIQLK